MKPNLITDFSGIHYDVNAWTDFKWVKATRQYDTKGRKSFAKWQWVTVDDLLEFRRKRKSTLIFHSIGHFREQDTETEQLCDLCFECDVSGETDFERRQNFKRMQNTVDEIYRFFADLGIDDGQIRFWFTGGRSIHVVVHHQPFSVVPMIRLNDVMKHIARYFNHSILDGDEYLPLDESLYANPKQFRMPNSYYPKYDAWKIELSPTEFDLSEAKLRKLAKEPRQPLYELAEIPTDPVPEAVEWYQERLQEFQELQKEREHIPTDITALKELEGIPACIAKLRTNTISTEGIRNQATLLDATFCKSTKVEKSEAIAIIDEWVQHIPDHLTSTKPGRPRTIATKSVVESVYRNPKYKFACGYAQALDLECDKEACPLHNKKAFQKWGKKVKVIPNFTPTVTDELVPVEILRSELSEKIVDMRGRSPTLASVERTAEGSPSACDSNTAHGHDLLLRTPPGSGKTVTTIRTLDPTGNILYAAPRRELLDESMNLISHSACQLIKPRGPSGKKPTDSPEAAALWEASALCQYYKHADALAIKRWNVAKWLCSKKCDIGMAKCPYWTQFKVVGSSAIVHQIATIPYHMESLIADNEPTVVFDEPTPETFIEQVDITAKVLTEEIARHTTPDITGFLERIRDVIENYDGKYTIGRAVMQKMVCGDSAQVRRVRSHAPLDNLKSLPKTERQQVIKEFIRLNVGKSDRAIADDTGISKNTIGRYRKQLEENGKIEIIAKREGRDGRKIKKVTVPKMAKMGQSNFENGTVKIENGTPESQNTPPDFEKMLDAVIAWMDVPGDYVEIDVDSISAYSTDRAWLVIICGVEHWIPRSLCFESDIDAKKLMIPYWLADQKGIDYDVTETTDAEDTPEGEIPLNFLPDLVSVLCEEFRKFKQGKDYNSQLALIQTPSKRKFLRLNLRKHLRIGKSRLLMLDAYGNAELLSKLTGRDIQPWSMLAAFDAEVIQIVDGYYGITTMWEKRARVDGGGIPRKALNRLSKAAANIAAKDPEGTVILTWKVIHAHIEKLQNEGKFDNRVEIDHFGNLKSSNRHEHKRQVIIIGAPSINPEELLQMAHCIWHDAPEAINDETIKDGNWRPYQYRDEATGNGYAVEVREYKDERLNLLLKISREYEIAQAAHRIRLLLYPGERKIWLLTNLPIDELPPTQITDLDEIIAETDPAYLAFVKIVEKITAEVSGVWGDLMVVLTNSENVINFSECHARNRTYILLRACHSELYNIFVNKSQRTVLRFLERAAKQLGYESTIVTIGGNVRLKVWHAGNLDVDKIRELYAEVEHTVERTGETFSVSPCASKTFA